MKPRFFGLLLYFIICSSLFAGAAKPAKTPIRPDFTRRVQTEIEKRQAIPQKPQDGAPVQIDPFRGTLFIESMTTSSQGITARVVLGCDPLSACSTATLKIFIPRGLKNIENDSVFFPEKSVALKKDEVDYVVCKIFIPTQYSRKTIFATITAINNGIRIERQYAVSLGDRAGAAKSAAPKPAGPVIVVPAEPEPETQPATAPMPLQSTSSNITVKGYWKYERPASTTLAPIKSAKVKLILSGSPEKVLATGYTDSSGHYSLTTTNSAAGPKASRNLFTQVWGENGAAVLLDGSSPPLEYISNTPAKNAVADGATVDMGTYYIGNESENWQALDATLTEYNWIKGKVNWTRPQVGVRWPVETWPHYHWNGTIDIPYKSVAAAQNSGMVWNDATIYHEYGHAVMYSAYGNTMPPGTGPSPHYIMSESSEGFALIEGWAEFMQCAVPNDPSQLADLNDRVTGTVGNIENNTWWNFFDADAADGNVIEGSFASIMWDILDGTGESGDNLSMGFDELWNIMHNKRPGGITSFWNYWVAAYPTTKTNLNLIYNKYGVYEIKPSTPTGILATDNTYTDKVRITWNAASLAYNYKIYRSTTNNSGMAVYIGTAKTSPYDDKTALPGTTYYYWVKAANYPAGYSGFSVSNPGTRMTVPWKSETVNWRVDYGNYWNLSGTITKPGATRIRLHFSAINAEKNYDYLKTNAGNNWTGLYSNVLSAEKAGNSIGLTLTSDGSNAGYFIIDRVDYQGTSTGAATKSGELFTPAPPAYVQGNWNFTYTWSGSAPGTSTFTFNSDRSMVCDNKSGSVYSGSYSVNGSSITIYFPPVSGYTALTTYKGTINSSHTSISGTMVSYAGDTGTWTATKATAGAPQPVKQPANSWTPMGRIDMWVNWE